MSVMLHLMRKITLGSLLLLVLLCAVSLQASAASALSPHSLGAINRAPTAYRVPANPIVQHLRQMVRNGQLAPTVRVLNTLPPTAIIQFPLVPSGIKAKFPQATGLVTMVRGSRDNSTSDTVTVDVQHMPPNITFTIFFIEFAGKPFGNVEYVADLTTRGDGSGETIFQCITFVAFAMDSNSPGTSQDNQEGTTSGVNLEHLGMWFSSLQDAQSVLGNPSLTGTIFDGGNPALHAGPQAMTDGQTAPVF
ncbi:MAG TPA: hypothetical protein VKU38_09055 [Ktedonobacteraceae bacterium]|nr:hypothetical protein [Ktedonobacteraceae bacterium]